MAELTKLLPAMVGLVAGLLLRRFGPLSERDGESVFRLVFYVFVPAVIVNSLATIELTPRLAIYPAVAVVMIGAGYLGGRIVAARSRLDPIRAAMVVSSCMVVNTGFQLPFVQLLYGAEGVARIAAFDVVNTVATFTLAYLTAAGGNPSAGSASVRVDRLVRNPAIYAVVVGLVLNLADISLPSAIAGTLAEVGAVTAVLIPLGIGLLFDPVGNGLRVAALMVATRMGTGLAVVTAVVLLLGFSGVDRTVLLLVGAAPLVFAGVAFASLEGLDVRLATNALSLSLVVSAIMSTLIILLAA